MTLAGLTVRDFRNIAAIDVEIPASGAVIIGANGQGKTNLLEAVYYLVLFRSFRGAVDQDLVRFGADGFFLAGAADSRITAGFELAGKQKKVTVDGQPVRRLRTAVGQLLAVTFSPADRHLIIGAPGVRRRFLDVLLALSVPGYLVGLAAMRSALKQRNAALRSGKPDSARAFDEPFVAAALRVTKERTSWVAEWEDRYRVTCEILGERETGTIQYRNASNRADNTGTNLREELDNAIDRDLQRGTTTVGPHRDDLRFTIGNRSLRRFGSAGQQRTAALALRFLEAETMTKSTGRTPIALYDDVFAELDEERQARLLELINEVLPGQALLAAPRDSEIPQSLLDRARWGMKGGRIEQ